jgi:hypothetical protein
MAFFPQDVFQIGGEFRDEGHSLSRAGMEERQPVGMEKKPMAPPRCFASSVMSVTCDRMADGRHVNADLVGPARDRSDLKKACLLKLLDNDKARLGVPGLSGFHGHALPVLPVPPEWPVDDTAALRHTAHDECQVNLVNLTISKLGLKRQIRLPGSGDDQQTRGLLIEAVNDARPIRIPHSGQLGIPVEKSVGQSPVLDASARVDDQSGRFFDNKDPIVGVTNPEIDILRTKAAFRFIAPE